jgi:hypothetical protein
LPPSCRCPAYPVPDCSGKGVHPWISRRHLATVGCRTRWPPQLHRVNQSAGDQRSGSRRSCDVPGTRVTRPTSDRDPLLPCITPVRRSARHHEHAGHSQTAGLPTRRPCADVTHFIPVCPSDGPELGEPGRQNPNECRGKRLPGRGLGEAAVTPGQAAVPGDRLPRVPGEAI